MKIHYTHANFQKRPSHNVNRPQGFISSGKHYAIFFHFHSNAIITLDGRQYRTEPHACVIVGKNTPHTLSVDKTILHDWIIFDGGEELEGLLSSLGLATDTVYYPENHEAISALIERIERHYFSGDEYFSVYFEARMRDLFILLARSQKKVAEPDDSRNMPSDARLHKLHKLLTATPNLQNYSEEKILHIAHCSRSTLFRHYRLLFGCSPYEDLQEACLLQSKRYLLETNFTVEEIAELLGYRSANVFICRFKRQNGTTPNEWRKQEKQKITKKS